MILLKSFKDKVLSARRLSLSDWLVLVEAWQLLFFFHLALRRMSYERLTAATRPISENAPDASQALVSAQRLQRLVGYASRLHPIPMTCLVRSLALRKMLNRRNISAQVCIGMNKTLVEVHAHAWVEVKGQAVGESEEISARFATLSRSGA